MHTSFIPQSMRSASRKTSEDENDGETASRGSNLRKTYSKGKHPAKIGNGKPRQRMNQF